MNLALDEYADNPIIGEIVQWPPRAIGVQHIRGCCPLIRKPFIEITFKDGTMSQRTFAKSGFISFWREATLVLTTITDIEITAEFEFSQSNELKIKQSDVQAVLQKSLEESDQIYAGGLYHVYVDQFGDNCRPLPAETVSRLAKARNALQNCKDQT